MGTKHSLLEPLRRISGGRCSVSNEFSVVCGACRFDVAIIFECDGEMAMCPICGQRDRLEEAQRVAGEHFLHQMIPDLQSRVRRDEHEPGYRWHAAPLAKEEQSLNADGTASRSCAREQP